MQYRSEIDGLRAVAVVPVILFHAGFSIFHGGFVGVDIFFVISGFLITRIIIRELEDDKFSLLTFYERRARRILPALTAMVLVSIPFAWVLMMPDPLENFGQSVVGTVFSANNILLAMTSNYWSLASEFKPLLHTWSLAVEEQFYIVFPLLMIISWPILRHRTILLVIALSIISFVACLALYERYPEGTFYLLHTRAWELGIGAIGAFWDIKRTPKNNDPVAFLGLALILLSIFLTGEDTPFPSHYTLAPVIGTFLVLLYARDGGRVAKLLSAKVLVWIGLISYSLYLWHQPIFAFARISSFEEPDALYYTFLIILCFGMSYLSWRFIERPFRNKTRISGRAILYSSVISTVAVACIGLLFHFNNGYPQRVFADKADTLSGMHISYNERIQTYRDDSFLIIGDSQGRGFANILFEEGSLSNHNLVYRHDISLCEYPSLDPADAKLVEDADVIYIAIITLTDACRAFLSSNAPEELNVVFVGPKHFGYNLNAFARIPPADRPAATARIFDEIVVANEENIALIPPHRYINLIDIGSEDGTHIRIFDDKGDIISADRVHVTKAGAAFLGRGLREHPVLKILQ